MVLLQNRTVTEIVLHVYQTKSPFFPLKTARTEHREKTFILWYLQQVSKWRWNIQVRRVPTEAPRKLPLYSCLFCRKFSRSS